MSVMFLLSFPLFIIMLIVSFVRSFAYFAVRDSKNDWGSVRQMRGIKSVKRCWIITGVLLVVLIKTASTIG